MTLESATDRINPATAVVTVIGALRLSAELHTINNTLQMLVADGVTCLVLDLTGCLYVDSAGLGTLIHTNGLIAERNGHVRLCGCNERVEALLRMTRTDALLPRDPDRAASLAALA